MTVQEIVKDWLVAHGYDGLASDECGCGVDGKYGLMPCEECFDTCKPAYKRIATEDDAEEFGCDVGDIIYVAEAK